MWRDCFRINRTRQWLAYALGVVYAVIVFYQGVVLNAVGIVLVILGMGIRFWAAGYIRKRRELAVNGPYAFVRNPLYLGSFLIGSGFAAFLAQPLLLGGYVASYWAFYKKTIQAEEKILTELFQDQYLDYKKNVPVFFPWRAPYRRGNTTSFSWQLAGRNREVLRIVTIVGLLVALYWVQCREEKNTAVLTQYGVGAVLVVLAVIIAWLSRFLKRQQSADNEQG